MPPWSRSAAAWSATWPASPRPAGCAASTACSCRRPCWRWSTPRSAARPQSTCRRARTWSAPSIRRARCIADTTVLRTLPDRELRAGLAEVVKYGAIFDAHFLDWLEAHADALLARDDAALTEAIARSLRVQGRRRRARSLRARPSRAAQLRPYLRPCDRGRTGLRRRGRRSTMAKRSRSAWCWRRACRRVLGLAPAADARPAAALLHALRPARRPARTAWRPTPCSSACGWTRRPTPTACASCSGTASAQARVVCRAWPKSAVAGRRLQSPARIPDAGSCDGTARSRLQCAPHAPAPATTARRPRSARASCN